MQTLKNKAFRWYLLGYFKLKNPLFLARGGFCVFGIP